MRLLDLREVQKMPMGNATGRHTGVRSSHPRGVGNRSGVPSYSAELGQERPRPNAVGAHGAPLGEIFVFSTVRDMLFGGDY